MKAIRWAGLLVAGLGLAGPAGAQPAPEPAGTPAAAPGPSATPAAPAPAGSPERNPAALLAALQRRYESTLSLRLAFTQRYTSRATGRSVEESGELVAARPGRMRWEYLKPEYKLFVLKGDNAWFYVPGEQVVYQMRTSEEATRRLPTLFLAGRGDFVRDYEATREPGDTLRLRLLPRGGAEDYEHLLVEIDPETSSIRMLSVVDVLGNRTDYEFRDEIRNLPVADASFEFQVPQGVEVVDRSR